MNINQLTDDELIQLGLDAEFLINDERFRRLYSFGGQLIAAQFLSLSFERKDDVNNLHMAKCSYDLFETNLRTFIDAKDQIIDRRNAENEQPDDEF